MAGPHRISPVTEVNVKHWQEDQVHTYFGQATSTTRFLMTCHPLVNPRQPSFRMARSLGPWHVQGCAFSRSARGRPAASRRRASSGIYFTKRSSDSFSDVSENVKTGEEENAGFGYCADVGYCRTGWGREQSPTRFCGARLKISALPSRQFKIIRVIMPIAASKTLNKYFGIVVVVL